MHFIIKLKHIYYFSLFLLNPNIVPSNSSFHLILFLQQVVSPYVFRTQIFPWSTLPFLSLEISSSHSCLLSYLPTHTHTHTHTHTQFKLLFYIWDKNMILISLAFVFIRPKSFGSSSWPGTHSEAQDVLECLSMPLP